MLLIEIIFCMRLPDDEINALAWKLGVSSGLALADPPSSRLPPKGNLSERCAAPKACRLVGEPALCGLLLGVGGAPLTGDALVGDALRCDLAAPLAVIGGASGGRVVRSASATQSGSARERATPSGATVGERRHATSHAAVK